MKILNGSGMAAFDRYCIDKLGVPGLLLMEHAGYHVAKEAMRTLEGFSGAESYKNILIVCGSGNNGGDGFVAARHLIRWGCEVSVGLLKPPESLPEDALTNFNLLKTVTSCKPHLLDETTIDSEIKGSTLVIDALFGTGLKGALKGLGRNVVEAINGAHVPVISVDIPSGLSADDGTVGADEHGRRVAVRADKTVTMGLPKTGFFSISAVKYIGQLIVADIGFPEALLLESVGKGNGNVFLGGEVRAALPPRDSGGHKGTFGKVLIIGGSRGMAGAVAMSAKSALRAGAGMVLIGVPESIRAEVASMVPEAMTSSLPEEDGYISEKAVAAVLSSRWKADVVLVGPGLGRANTTMEFLKGVISKLELPLVLDADALFLEKLHLSLRFRSKPTFLTPHDGEADRILANINPAFVNPLKEETLSRFQRAEIISRDCDSITVLKGPFTISCDVDGNFIVNPNGNSGMATAGSGDILAGILVALVAQASKSSDKAAPDTDDFLKIAAVAAYVHGLAGDICAEENSEYGVTAPYICDFIPKAFKLLMDLPLKAKRAYPDTLKYDRLTILR